MRMRTKPVTARLIRPGDGSACDHRTGRLLEISKVCHERAVHLGVMDDIGYNSEGDIVGYEYKCAGCGRVWIFPATHNIRPLWLRKIVDQLMNIVD
jgi:hypothetical protein